MTSRMSKGSAPPMASLLIKVALTTLVLTFLLLSL